MQSLNSTGPITIRESGGADAAQLDLLAQLDSAPPLEGRALVAEFDGVAVAAISLDGEREIADPFVPTEGVLELLRVWAEGLRSS